MVGLPAASTSQSTPDSFRAGQIRFLTDGKRSLGRGTG